MDRELATEDLLLVKKVFDQNQTPFFLAYGTLLGAVREGDFIAHDDDIDLGVIEPIDLKTRKKIGWTLYDLGFDGQEIMFRVFNRMEPAELGYNGDGETGIIVAKRNVKMTIFFFKETTCDLHGEEMVCIPKLGAPPLISYPAKFTRKLEIINFKGEKFLVPSPPEDYLSWVYEDWKDPLGRDHGALYPETHSGAMMKDVLDQKRVILKKGENPS